MVRVPFVVVETILPIEMVSPMSGSVSFEVRFMRVADASSVMVIASSFAVGAEFEHAMRIVPVAELLMAPLMSSTW
jgi:hypothetical protein